VVVLLNNTTLDIDSHIVTQFSSIPNISKHLEIYSKFIDKLLLASYGKSIDEFRNIEYPCSLYFPFNNKYYNNLDKMSLIKSSSTNFISTGEEKNSSYDIEAFNEYTDIFNPNREYATYEFNKTSINIDLSKKILSDLAKDTPEMSWLGKSTKVNKDAPEMWKPAPGVASYDIRGDILPVLL
jgi:hypothetical protein